MDTLKNLPILTSSCALCSIAVNWVAIPNGFVATGTTGLALILQELFSINYSLIYYFITLIILVTTYFILGKEESKKIIILSVLYPCTLALLSTFKLQIVIANKFIAIVLFGILFGIGTGLSYSTGYTYGGTDTIGKILKHSFLKRLSIKNILIIVDGTIIVSMLTAYSVPTFIYTIIGQLVYVNCYNLILIIRKKNV